MAAVDLSDLPAALPAAASVRGWLESIGKQRHAAAFVDNFESVDELRLAASQEGIAAVLEGCGVTTMGDKAAIRRALEALVSSG